MHHQLHAIAKFCHMTEVTQLQSRNYALMSLSKSQLGVLNLKPCLSHVTNIVLYLYFLKEHDTLEDDLVEATERLLENEKTIQKQQRDLEGFQELEERVNKIYVKIR